MKNKTTLCAFAVVWSFSIAQVAHSQSDSTDVDINLERGELEGEAEAAERNSEALIKLHSPKKATIMSAVLPGLGQIYNKKYWKVPIIYGGFAVAGWYLQDNIKQIDLFKNAFIAETDDDPNTINDTGFTSSQLDDLISQYKTWRDLSYIAIGAIYVLNIIDANVDAHLFYFDVGEDLSMNIQPFVTTTRQPITGVTLSLKL
ncbi:MAG: DUF5683 domain-containing protein [Flavobacteriales bacterium]|nr:DUF5683 domain-containing protein [Flavobacteriales bacterium]